MEPKFFKTAEDFRKWLLKNHDKFDELFIGFHRKGSGKKSITYPEAVDEALCFGWIDGVRRRLDDTSYIQRFTPRRPKSIWSLVNIRHVERLKNEGRMHAAGLAEFEKRDPKRTGVYSFENKPVELSEAYKKLFQANKKAWEFWQKQPPFFTKTAAFWVMSAKKEETRLNRLRQLIENAANGQRHGAIQQKPKEK